MGSFNTYLRLGYEHIVNSNALEHIIFIIALMAAYQPKSWLRIIAAVTIFTAAHALSLTLSAFDIVDVDKRLIDFLIPLTIVFMALYNLTKVGQKENARSKYWITGFFGIIHGLGFASSYNMLTMGEAKYWTALFPFNLGIELGQLLVVVVILLLMVVFQLILNFRYQTWNIFFSGGAFLAAFIMCLENWPF